MSCLWRQTWPAISIHALREEGDSGKSRPLTSICISIHALREEGDADNDAWIAAAKISIHALREEGDIQTEVDNLTAELFLSTPSARRATTEFSGSIRYMQISIHALREEGDLLNADLSLVVGGFLSTPSARRATGGRSSRWWPPTISIHALREEGDQAFGMVPDEIVEFLSTPSARRATAKTETKSLFSNKLYNILHEFRRALIYSGSKNYPNHAKRLKNLVRRCRKDAENSPFAPGRETQNNSRPSCSKGG